MPSYSVTASGNLADAWKAFDGKSNTYWLSTSAGNQLEFNFGKLVLVKGVRFTPVDGKLDAFPTKITVLAYVETSGGTAVTLGELTTATPVVGEGQVLYFDGEKKYRRYAFLAEGSSEIAIAEIDFLVLKSIILPEAEPILQVKTVTPSTTVQTVTPDDGYDGLSKVTVNAAPPSGTNTSDATATATDIKSGKTAYGSSGKLTGSMATVSVPTPTISVSSAGLITASNSQSAGYTAGGSTSGTKQLTTQSTKTWTPTTSNQTISSGTYLTGTQTIKGDSKLLAKNIVSDITIFGVTGTCVSSPPNVKLVLNNPNGIQVYVLNVWTVASGLPGQTSHNITGGIVDTGVETRTVSPSFITVSSAASGTHSITPSSITGEGSSYAYVYKISPGTHVFTNLEMGQSLSLTKNVLNVLFLKVDSANWTEQNNIVFTFDIA